MAWVALAFYCYSFTLERGKSNAMELLVSSNSNNNIIMKMMTLYCFTIILCLLTTMAWVIVIVKFKFYSPRQLLLLLLLFGFIEVFHSLWFAFTFFTIFKYTFNNNNSDTCQHKNLSWSCKLQLHRRHIITIDLNLQRLKLKRWVLSFYTCAEQRENTMGHYPILCNQ